MTSLSFVLASGNFLFCFVRAFKSIRNARLIAMYWLLMAYHAAFLILLASDGTFSWYKGFTGETLVVRETTIEQGCLYIFLFNLIFAGVESLTWKLVAPRRMAPFALSNVDMAIRGMQYIYTAFLIVGGALYWKSMQGLGYRDYVEFVGSNWPIVFFWAASPLAVLLAMQRRYFWAIAVCVPSMVLSLTLSVRSFLLLTFIPVFVVILMQQAAVRKPTSMSRRMRLFVLLIGPLVLLNSAIIYLKIGEARSLPDAGLVNGFIIVLESERHASHQFGFNSLLGYGLNLVNPFVRLLEALGLSVRPVIVDTPVYLANIIDGVPVSWDVYFHYPALWYSDAFVSFGWSGLVLAAGWGLVNSSWEAVIRRRSWLIAVFLPFYTWHAYMLVRGATAIASVPFSYAAYIAFAVALCCGHVLKTSHEGS